MPYSPDKIVNDVGPLRKENQNMKGRTVYLLGIFVLIICLLTSLVVTPVVAAGSFPMDKDDPEIVSALQYLKSMQAADGSIGSYADSAWVVMAIASVKVIPEQWETDGVSIVDYLKDNAALLGSEFNLGTAYGRMVLAIIAADEDPSAFGTGDSVYAPGGDYLSKMKELHNGTQFTDGFGSVDLLNDDFWALMALVASRESLSSPLVLSTKNFIINNQATDGGWSWGLPSNPYYSGSDADNTAAAIMALIAAGENPTSTVITDGLNYLKSQQDPSGGFLSWGAANLGSTNWAVPAIRAAGRSPVGTYWTPGITNPVEYILGFQEEAGSFFDPGAFTPARERNTANAIVSLVGETYPVRYQHIESVGGTAYSVFPLSVILLVGLAIVTLTCVLFIIHRKQQVKV